MSRFMFSAVAALALTGCASMVPPSPEKLAGLPVVEFPAKPPAGEFIFKLPKGKPIPTRVIIEGTALASGADQTLDATLANDLYVYGKWVSEDGRHWQPAKDVINVRVAVSLPSDVHPAPGEIRVTVDKAAR
jgi:hypothetical protein